MIKDMNGKKFDAGKAMLDTHLFAYFPKALTAVAYVSMYGARKYTTGGWKTVPDGYARYSDARARHVLLPHIEGDYDVGDSGLAHAAQEAWNALARLEMAINSGKLKVMSGNDIVDGKPVLGTSQEIKI